MRSVQKGKRCCRGRVAVGGELLSNLKLNNQFALENNSGFNLRPFYLLVLVVYAINENPRQAEIEGAPGRLRPLAIHLTAYPRCFSLSGTDSVRPRLVVICTRRVFGRVKLIYEVKLICAEPFCASPVRRVH